MLVTVDKFTKWAKARSISAIKFEQAMLFFLDIVHRFGVPKSIIMDNDMQFIRKKFVQFYDEYHIHVDWAAMAHPKMDRLSTRMTWSYKSSSLATLIG